MTETVTIDIPLRTHSAKSIEELRAKARAKSLPNDGQIIGWYVDLVKKFNAGCDIFEINRTETEHNLIDLFDEAAKARTVDRISIDLDPATVQFLKAELQTNDLAINLMNAFYAFDRAVDTEARDFFLAGVTEDGHSRQCSIYSFKI
ncbi:MAG: hypothetical protein JWO78_687 [Micavibrio sp.]|nr:hypothetical protein [Micavibrio sp.]